MSWDLVFWKGAPTDEPPQVWKALAAGQEVRFVRPLTVVEVRRAFEEEYGDDLEIEASDEGGTTLMGRGWEGGLADGDPYLYLTCGWGRAKDDDWIRQIVRAGLRAGCWVYDPQSRTWWEPPEPGWDPDAFDVWDAARPLDD